MTDTKPTFHRRRILAFLATAPVLVPGVALAHDGHGAGHVTVTPTILRRKANRLDLVLTFFNSGTEPVTLSSIFVDEAKVTGAHLPFDLPAGALEEQKLTLRFSGQVPGIFTIGLDFGADGQGPVTVML